MGPAFTAPVCSVVQPEDSRWWPWMHRLKRIRSNTHTLGGWALASAPGAAAAAAARSCGFCVHPCRYVQFLYSQLQVRFDHFWSRIVNAKQTKAAGRCWGLLSAGKCNNVSLGQTAGCLTPACLTQTSRSWTAKGKLWIYEMNKMLMSLILSVHLPTSDLVKPEESSLLTNTEYKTFQNSSCRLEKSEYTDISIQALKSLTWLEIFLADWGSVAETWWVD